MTDRATFLQEMRRAADDPFYRRFPPTEFIDRMGLASNLTSTEFVLAAWDLFKIRVAKGVLKSVSRPDIKRHLENQRSRV